MLCGFNFVYISIKMKNIKLVFLAIMAVFMFAQCEKDDNAKNAPKTEEVKPAAFNTTVNGEEWQANKVTAAIQDGEIVISAIGEDKSLLTIILAGTNTGNYNLEDGGKNQVVFTSKENEQSISTQGEVVIETIDEDNRTISGSFEAVASVFLVAGISLEGTFENIELLETEVLPTDNSFSAKVDGNDFNSSSVVGELSGGIINVTANGTEAGVAMALKIPSNIEVGTYEIVSVHLKNKDVTAAYNPGLKYGWIPEEGELEVTKHDVARRLIEGTFHFVAERADLVKNESAAITEGQFSIRYTREH